MRRRKTMNTDPTVTERILDLTLEIITQLTGEIFTAVRSGDLFSIVAPQHDFALPERTDHEKLLELSNQVMELLMGELQAGDATHLNNTIKEEVDEEDDGMGELGSLEGHREHNKAAMLEEPPDRSPLYSLDALKLQMKMAPIDEASGSERPFQDSKQEQEGDDQDLDIIAIKCDIKEEEEDSGSWLDQRSGEDIGTTIRQRVTSAAADPELGQNNYETSKRSPELSPEFNIKHHSRNWPKVDTASHHRALHTTRSVPSVPSDPKILSPPKFIIGDRGQRLYVCQDCGKCFISRITRNNHRRIHKAKRPYSCPECGATFRQKKQLLGHRESLACRPLFLCSGCGEGFTGQGELNKHQRYHCKKPQDQGADRNSVRRLRGEEEKPSVSNHQTSSMEGDFSAVRRPERVQKNEETSQRWPTSSPEYEMEEDDAPRYCPIVDTAAPNSHLYPADRSSDPVIPKRPTLHKGGTPNISSGHRSTAGSPDPAIPKRPPLPKFIIGEGGQKLFVCEDCGKCFLSRITRNNHRRIHREKRPYSCGTCGKSYKLKKQLLEHRESHTSMSFYCVQCGLSFQDEKQLNGHRKLHNRGQGGQVGRRS